MDTQWTFEAESFGIKASTNELRCLACSDQQGYTRIDGLIRLSTRLNDCEVGYKSRTGADRKEVIERLGGCHICTS